MKVHPSECSVIVHRSVSELYPVRLWELGNKTLVWPLKGIVGCKPPVDPASGRVSELNPPATIEVETVHTEYARMLLVRVPPECALEMRPVVVVDELTVA